MQKKERNGTKERKIDESDMQICLLIRWKCVSCWMIRANWKTKQNKTKMIKWQTFRVGIDSEVNRIQLLRVKVKINVGQLSLPHLNHN